VLYVTSGGSDVNIYYWTPTADGERASLDAADGWTLTFHGKATGYRLTAANLAQGNADSSACTITVDGKVTSHSNQSGGLTRAICST
jgi:hypothetical protein